MIPILYGETETSFISNGLGRLSDAISCVVTEERNGEYELEMDYPVGGAHYSDIQKSRIVSAVPADGKSRQPFRIYRISKPINGIVTIYAEHISYQLSLIPVMPFTAGSAAEAVVAMGSNAVGTNPFTLWTDVTTVANYNQRIPKSFRACLGGSQGSFLDTYGGEFEWDNWTVKIHASRGADRGVTIRYGKNLTDLVQEENIQDTYTGILPYWYNEGQETLVILTEKVVMSSNASLYPFSRVLPYDFSSYFNTQPTEAQLRQAAQSYVNANNIGIPKVSLRVEFAALWQTEEYKNVANQERVNLCDAVTVEFEKLGVSAKAKVIKTKYNVLLERYDSIEIGDAKSSFSDTFVKAQEETAVQIAEATSGMDNAIAHATELISGGLGGYVYIKPNANGQPEEILIMDQPDINTAVNVIRMNRNGIAFSTNGYNPASFDTAWTINGAFNASFITAGVLTANLIKAGILSDGTTDSGGNPDPNFILNMATGALTAKKLSVDSTYFDLQEDGTLTATNVTASGKLITEKTSSAYHHERVIMQGGQILFQTKAPADTSWTTTGKLDTFLRWFTLDVHKSFFVQDASITKQSILLGISSVVSKGSSIEFPYYTDRNEQMFVDDFIAKGHIAFAYTNPYTTPTEAVEVYASKFEDNELNVHVEGGLFVSGTKARAVKTKKFGTLALNAMESTYPVFSDLGCGTIGGDGKAYIYFDPDFVETIDLNHEYQVFITKTSEGEIEYTDKSRDFFVVIGSPGTTFDWVVYLRQIGYTSQRLKRCDTGDNNKSGKNYFYSLIDYDDTTIDNSVDAYFENYNKEIEDYDN